MKRNNTILLLLLFVCSFVPAKQFPYQNEKLSPEERVTDLLNRMTLDEKIAQIRHIHSWDILNRQELDQKKLAQFCQGTAWGFVEGFPLTSENCKRNFYQIQKYMVEETRLGIPVFICAESLHGLVQEGATIYPQNVALGSTFNPDLAYQRAAGISAELHYTGVNQVLGPCIDVVRELRWGRVEESFGEDPILCGKMAVAEVKGYLDNGISPMLKHYGPHGSPTGGLNLASVDCSVPDLFDIYLKPFEMVISQTPVMAVMSSYNAWNREPNSSSYFLMTEVLRNRFGFKGYTYSDWGVVDMLKTFHRTARGRSEAATQVLTAGLDVEASSQNFAVLKQLVDKKELDVKYVDQAVSRVLYAKFKMGVFDDLYSEKGQSIPSLHSKENIRLSRQIADESIVLLKNDNNLLPLRTDIIKSIAVIGPNADEVQFGDYTWSKEKKDGVTPLQGIMNLTGNKIKINYAKGCSISSLDESGIQEAVETAQKSDVAIVIVGSSSTAFVRHSKLASTSGEGIDLHDISLTGVQEKLIKAIHSTGKPVVVVLVTGKPFAIPWVKSNIPAILCQWYAGEEAGNSLADVLFGNINPSGKIPFSFPQSTGHLPCYYNHLSTDKGYYKSPGSYDKPGRDYVFASPDPLWAFGHGMSYTSFEYLSANTDKSRYHQNDTIHVKVSLKNNGTLNGKEVVQLYIRDLVSTVMTPVKMLKDFKKSELKPGEIKEITLSIPVSELYLTDQQGNKYFEAGEFELQIGTASDDIKHRVYIAVGEERNLHNSGIVQDSQNLPESKKIIRITGIVRDLQATPVPGVSITASSGNIKSTTDEAGEFIIEAGEFDLLTFSRKGFSSRTVAVDGQQNINVKLNYGH